MPTTETTLSLLPFSKQKDIIVPERLSPHDIIAICSPASAVTSTLFTYAKTVLECLGFRVEIYPHAQGRVGSYSGTYEQRLHDISDALTNPAIKAVMCARGGYGAVHLLEDLDKLPLQENPKWLIGFSDISALHALMHTKGIASMHASMLKGLIDSKMGDIEANTAMEQLFALLKGRELTYRFPSHPLNRTGTVEGTLIGGNLAVLSALIGTKYDVFKPDTILFIEDINEPIYKIERILWQLRLKGVLPQFKGLIVGHFTGAPADANYDNTYQMIYEMTKDYSYPVAFNAPIGHAHPNYPLIESATYSLTV